MDSEKFLEIIDSTPLVSIDIVLRDASGNVLLGRRANKPAKGYWFVPGGRIRKNETLREALARISVAELGFEIDIEDTRLLGAYDHIYDDNFQGKEGVNTHYVSLGYEVQLPSGQAVDFDSQHSEVQWWPIDELLESGEVHENTKAFFGG